MNPSPNASVLNGFLIDDDISASESAKRFSSGRLQLVFREPEALESFAIELFEAQPTIVIVDYRLDERAGSSGSPARYKASALAQQLRDLAGEDGTIDFPIVLHSAEGKIKQLFQPEKTAHDLFDDVILKGARKDEEIVRHLEGLAIGYQQLVSSRPYSENLLSVFGLDERRARLIEHQEIQQLASQTDIPHVFARFILNRLVRRNSILANEATALTLSGVNDSDTGGKEILFRALAEAGVVYTGVFSTVAPLYWRVPLDVTIDDWLKAPLNSLTASERVERLSQHFNYGFKAAISTWNNSSDERFTHACAVCSSPTLVAHSVSVLEQTSGPLTERRRICFNCVQLDRHLAKANLVIDALDKPTEEAVRRGEVARK